MDLLTAMAETWRRIKERQPLVHHITNYVTVNDCANITLACGASPVMASDPGEAAEMAAQANALVLNIGTLDARLVESMLLAGRRAAAAGVPVVFDPVGVGATRLRLAAAQRIMREVPLTVIRGNAAEIKTLAGVAAVSRGVDAAAGEDGDARAAAQALACRQGCVVAATGRRDIIAARDAVYQLDNGHAMLTTVSGTGCMTTSLVGCCCGTGADPLIAAAAGVLAMGVAGELAQAALQPGEGSGMFRVRLLDAVYNLTPAVLQQRGRLKILAGATKEER